MAFDTSDLSQENILRDVHDPVTQTLRTTATATIITPPQIQVSIDKTEDSIEVWQAVHDNLNANANLQIANTDVSVINPVPISDAGGSITVDGTITANAGSGTFAISAVSLPLPTGAATSALQTTGNTFLSSIDTKLTAPITITGSVTANAGTDLNTSALSLEATQLAISAKLPATLGQKTSANSFAVVIASDQSAVPVSQSGTWNINNISGTISLPTGAATETKQDTIITSLSSIDAGIPVTLGQTTMAASMPVVIASNQTAVPVSGPLTDVELRATPVPVSGTVTANAGTNLNTSALNLEATQVTMSAKLPATLGQKTMANSMAVVLASDQTSIPVAATLTAETTKIIGSVNIAPVATATVTSVASSATNVTLLASNSSRKMATFYNDSTKDLFLKFGATASTTSFTVLINPDGFYELPLPMYTGIIDGIWSSASGSARITEY
jgi:hypothetical protein